MDADEKARFIEETQLLTELTQHRGWAVLMDYFRKRAVVDRAAAAVEKDLHSYAIHSLRADVWSDLDRTIQKLVADRRAQVSKMSR